MVTTRGSAILTALFVMILVAIAATAMSLRLQIDINRTQLIKDTALIERLAKRSTLLAMILLNENIKHLSRKIENVDKPLYHFKMIKEEGFTINSELSDLQARFNLNNLVSIKSIRPFSMLLMNTNKNLDAKNALLISYATYEWVKRLNMNKGNTSLDQYYASKHYKQTHAPMVSPTEFRLIKGVTKTVYNNTLPYITTLPTNTVININSASQPVLQTLGAGLSKAQAKKIIQTRGVKGFKTINDFLKNPDIQKLHIKLNKKQFTLTSDYFLSSVKVVHMYDHFVLFSIIQRKKEKRNIETTILQETINTL